MELCWGQVAVSRAMDREMPSLLVVVATQRFVIPTMTLVHPNQSFRLSLPQSPWSHRAQRGFACFEIFSSYLSNGQVQLGGIAPGMTRCSDCPFFLGQIPPAGSRIALPRRI